MNLKKSALSVAISTVIGLGSVNISQAAIIEMDYNGLFTFVDPAGNNALTNTSKPYYYDATWGYGLRTQITGTMSFDTNTGAGSGTVTPFQFFGGGLAIASDVNFQAISNGLMLGAMNFGWTGSSDFTIEIVLDASGLFGALASGLPPVGGVLDLTACASLSNLCATPASNDLTLQIGPAPIATSSFNVVGGTGFGTTIGQLSLGTDDGIGGSPMDNSPFSLFNANFDFTSLTVTNVSAVPIPASVWLFGSGLFALSGIARRKKH